MQSASGSQTEGGDHPAMVKRRSTKRPTSTMEPLDVIQALKSTDNTSDLLKDVRVLEVSLRTEQLNWLKDFIKQGGLDVLVFLLLKFSKLAT